MVSAVAATPGTAGDAATSLAAGGATQRTAAPAVNASRYVLLHFCPSLLSHVLGDTFLRVAPIEGDALDSRGRI